jgi:hypothetical protein
LSVLPVCGNGACEFLEIYICPSDCWTTGGTTSVGGATGTTSSSRLVSGSGGTTSAVKD